jgi:hypothetical protein
MQCGRCHREITEDQTYVHQGKTFCDGCLMDIGLSIKECDPWATYVDTRARNRAGLKGTDGLTDMEAQVYSLVKSRGRISREEVMEHLGLSDTDLTFQLVPLMHSDLVKEVGEGDRMFLITPSGGGAPS